MDVKELLTVVRRRPFLPFKLRMNDGREFVIGHLEWITVTRRLVTIISEEDQSTTLLEPILIASVHFAAPPKVAPQNGPTQA